MTGRRTAQSAALLLSALSSGVLFGTKVSLGPSTKRFTPSTYVEVQQATVRNLRPVMGALLPASVVANLVDAVVAARQDRRSSDVALVGAALVCQVASVVVTARYELPINSRVLAWSATDPPEGWQAARGRWDRFHTVRTATSLVGLACLVARRPGRAASRSAAT